MKKRILALVAAMLCVVTVLASCASSMKFEKIVGDAAYNDENPTLTAAKKVAVEGDVADRPEGYEGDLVVFEDYKDGKTTYTVYNLATDAVVYTVTDSEKSETVDNKTTDTVVDIEIGLDYNAETEVSWFAVSTTTTVTVTEETADGVEEDETETVVFSLRNAKGEEFATFSNKGERFPRFAQKLDLILLEDAVYRVAEDGSIAKAFDMPAFAAFPALQNKQGDYYYAAVRETNSVYVYDAELNMVAYVQAPSYVDEVIYHVLNDGNVLLQYTEELGQFEEDYDFSEDGERFNLYSFLLNVEKNSTKELKLDYIVARLDNQAETDNWLYSEKIENVAWIFEIEDQRLNQTPSAMKMVKLNNKAKVKGEISGLVPNQNPYYGIKSVAPDRWVVSDLAGNKFLLNGEGEVMGNVNGLNLENLNAFYILMNNKIYDWDLNVKYDMAANKATTVQQMNHGVLMTNEDGETLFYANGEVKTLINKDAAEKNVVAMKNKSFFVVATLDEENAITSYKVYNDLGNAVITINKTDATFNPANAVVCAAGSNNAMLIRGIYTNTEDDTSKWVYYRIG